MAVTPDHLPSARADDPYDRDEYYYDPAKQRDLLPLYLPYTHEIPASRHGEGLEVEHIVSLEEAHESGMRGRSPREKRALAQDTLNQCLARPGTNDAKGSKSIAEWQPPSPVNLRWMADRVLRVKDKYRLRVSPAERAALERILGSRSLPRDLGGWDDD